MSRDRNWRKMGIQEAQSDGHSLDALELRILRVAACRADIVNNRQWNQGFNHVMGMRRLSLMRGQLRASRLSIDAHVFCCADWRSAGWQDFNSICFREELSPRREFKFGATAKQRAAITTGRLSGA
jgi:hypothetical protein